MDLGNCLIKSLKLLFFCLPKICMCLHGWSFFGALVDILASTLAELAYFFHAGSETPISLSLSQFPPSVNGKTCYFLLSTHRSSLNMFFCNMHAFTFLFAIRLERGQMKSILFCFSVGGLSPSASLFLVCLVPRERDALFLKAALKFCRLAGCLRIRISLSALYFYFVRSQILNGII